MSYTSTFPTDPLRGLPMRPLHGLGAVSAAQKAALLEQARQNFTTAADDLIRGVKQGCERVRSNATLFARAVGTNEVLDRIEQITRDNVEKLKRPDAQGVPLFLRKPESARSLLTIIQNNANELLQDHKELLVQTGFATLWGDWGFESLKEFINQAVAKLFEIISLIVTLLAGAIAEAAMKFPVAALAIAAVGGIGTFAYLKFMRIL